jgi:hypothetical protein
MDNILNNNDKNKQKLTFIMKNINKDIIINVKIYFL